MMLRYMGLDSYANKIEKVWRKIINEDKKKHINGRNIITIRKFILDPIIKQI